MNAENGPLATDAKVKRALVVAISNEHIEDPIQAWTSKHGRRD